MNRTLSQAGRTTPCASPRAFEPERISVHVGTLVDLRQAVALLANITKLNLLLSELRVQLVVLCAEAPLLLAAVTMMPIEDIVETPPTIPNDTRGSNVAPTTGAPSQSAPMTLKFLLTKMWWGQLTPM
jgi:hypothetical protein